MKLNKFFLVSIFLLAVITLGVASAAEDSTASELAIEEGDLNLDVPDVDEIDSDGGVDSDGAVSDDNVQDKNILGSNADSDIVESTDADKLSGEVSPKYNFTVDLPMSGSANVAQWGQPIGFTLDMGNATGDATITFAGETYTAQLVDGVLKYEITKYSKVSNNQQLKIVYSGDDYYKTLTITRNVHVQLNDVVANGADYGQSAFMVVNLHNATGYVTFTINGNTYRKELVNGTLTQEFTNYTLGRNTISFAYEGDENYNPITKSYTVNVNANIEAPTIYNFQPAIIKVYLGGATGQVKMSMGSEEYTVDVVNGVATQEFENYEVGNNKNKLTVEYLGDDTFNPFSTTKAFTVLDKENATILTSVYKTADKNMVVVCIPYGTGNVNVTINGKKEVLELNEGIALYNIDESDVITEINVTYDGNYRLNGANSTDFKFLNNIVNAETYMYYFNQADGGKLFGFIENGTTLDFQGKIINPDQSNNVYFDVSKPVNIISTTNDAYIDLNTTAGSLLGENPGNRFSISYGGSGTNMTGIDFHNTQLWLTNTHHVVLDRVSNVIEDQRVGSGVGATSIRDGSTWVTVKNSYFYTRNNGGSSSLVIAWADYCTFHNNTIKVEGNVGNMVYLTTYNVQIPEGVVPNVHNNITNNRILGPQKAAAICWGFVVAGSDNLFANNWINYTGVGFNAQWGMGAVGNNVYVNNTLIGGSSANLPAGSIAYNNYISGTMSTGANSVVYNNTVGKAMTVGAGAEAYNNTAGGLTMSGAEGVAHDNIINGASTISATGVEIYDNVFEGDNLIKFSNSNAKNGIFANNTVVGAIEISHRNAKNNTITGNNITTSKNYAIDLKTNTGTETVITNNILNSAKGFGNAAINHKEDETLVIDNYQDAEAEISAVAENIKVGQTAVFNVNVNETSMTNAIIVIGGKEYTVNLVDGKGTVEVSGLAAGNYDVDVVSADKNFGGRNSTTLNVTKNDIELVVDAPDTIECLNYNVTVNVNDATGTITFTIDGNDTVVPIVNGVAVYTFADLTEGVYKINISYSGDDKYFANKTNVTINVAKNRNVEITAEDETFDKVADEYTAVFENYQGNPISNAVVIFTIGNETYKTVTDENGEATVDLSLTRGKYNINVAFEANEDFDAANATATILVSDKTTITLDSIAATSIGGSLKDANGDSIANATIVYTIAGGNKLKTTTDANGSFKINVDKNGLVVISFEGDEISEPCSTSIKLDGIVPEKKGSSKTTKVASKFVAKNKKFKAKKKTKKYVATLKTSKGKAIKNVKVTLKIKGKTYKAKTNAKGKAVFKIKKLTKKGTYKAKIKFAGNKLYKATSKKVKIKVKK